MITHNSRVKSHVHTYIIISSYSVTSWLVLMLHKATEATLEMFEGQKFMDSSKLLYGNLIL